MKKKPIKKKMGAPTTYNQTIAKQICEYIIEGKSLRQIQAIDGMPPYSVILKWCIRHEEFAQQYAQAKASQTEAFNEEIHSIADDESIPVERAKLMIETRKWVMGKMRPKKYGDAAKLKLIGGDDGDNPIKYQNVEKELENLNPAALLALNAALNPDEE